MRSVTIIGTGLIGASIGLALKQAGYTGALHGLDARAEQLDAAINLGAISSAADLDLAVRSDVVVLAVPVLAVKDWMQRLSPRMGPHQLITDVGSTKAEICELAGTLANSAAVQFLPGHPMAGKESGGAALAEAALFQNAMWLFCPVQEESTITQEWRSWVTATGARTRDLDPVHHDELLAWISHLPQYLSTAFAALLEDRFGDDPETREQIAAIGGRALRETTRLGASPYSMWRDVALTNTAHVSETLLALEQELAHLRENLRTPELRDEFARANRFRARRTTLVSGS